MRDAIRKVINFDFGRDEAAAIDSLDGFESEGVAGTIIVATTDKLSQHWAPRWLGQAGLDVVQVTTVAEALDEAASSAPVLAILDASLRNGGNETIFEEFKKDHAGVPMVALCSSSGDVKAATRADVDDIVRRPYDWEVITRRAVRSIKARETLSALQLAHSKLDNMQSTIVAAQRVRSKQEGIDELTGLPNSNRFRSLLHKIAATHGRAAREQCVLVIGVDRYRVVQEAVGRSNAKQLLGHFADRLRTCLRDREIIGDTDGSSVTAVAAKLSGPRFALLVSNGETEQILRVRDAIFAQLEQPFEVNGQSIYLTASIGAAILPRDATSADGLMLCAETAMLDAQEMGSGFEFYAEVDNSSSTQMLHLDTMLRDAVRNGDLTLEYQPITDTMTGKVVAAEALLRWHHAEKGSISPSVFVPLAERTGLMREIGDFVIRTACTQLRTWLDQGLDPIRIAINLSLCQLSRGDVVKVVQTALAENDIDPGLLEFELSERGVLNKRPEVVREVHRLKALGVRISIDDFGTGQAAIGYLKDLPIDVIKIDRSYVQGAGNSAREEAIASGMVALARRLDATVIAEGVETAAQLGMLKSWGSQECQGFLFSPAVTGDVFAVKFASKAA